MTSPATGPTRILGLVGLAAVVGVALLEIALGLLGPRRAPKTVELQAAAAVLRSEIGQQDLIAVAPAWIDPLVRTELGDLMPTAMLGRPDGRRYPNIFELGFGGARHEDTHGLTTESERQFGGFVLRRYRQVAVEVSYDFVEHFLDASVLQYLPPASPSSALAGPPPESQPCLFQGPLPSACPPPGPAGAFVCPLGRVERRTLEIAYRPRYGLSISVGTGRVTELHFSNIPAAAWRGASLHLWLGLHDYHARKNASGPAEVLVELDGQVVPQPLLLTPTESERQLSHIALPLPATSSTMADAPHSLRLRVSAESAPHHHVGLLAELRR